MGTTTRTEARSCIGRLGQPSLVEAWLPGKLGQNRRLERIAELVDWSRLETTGGRDLRPPPVGRHQLPAPADGQGAAVCSSGYNLSDPQLEEALG